MDEGVFLFGPFRLDPKRYELSEGETPSVLPRLAMDLLLMLVRSGGRLLSRTEIARAMWPHADPEDAGPSINTAINRIRQVLGDDPAQPVYVQTVIGKGYRFMAPVKTAGRPTGEGAKLGGSDASEMSSAHPGGSAGEMARDTPLPTDPAVPPIALDKLHAWYVAGAPVEVSALRIDHATSVIAVRGALRLGPGLKMLELQLNAEMDRGVRALVLDMAAVPLADSAGLGMLLHLFGTMTERGGVLRICGVTERVRELLRMTHTDSLLPIDADVGASLAALSSPH